jgi:ubiquinone/menaquinone biosynthesis C-methylase UbiE
MAEADRAPSPSDQYGCGEVLANMQTAFREQQGHYGIDGGLNAVAGLVILGAIGLILADFSLTHARAGHIGSAVFEALVALVLLQAVPMYLYSTLRGKFVVWAKLLETLRLQGDERVLDMGCGRGAVLSLLAKRVPRGRAAGLDLWRPQDQSGNRPEATWRNLEAEGVRSQCELFTGDMRAMPFRDAAFDFVASSLAIHNISGRERRVQAINEAVRVLKPGGRLLIADLMWTKSYALRLRDLGMEDVRVRNLDWRFWYGALGLAALVSARKPLQPRR